MYQITLTKRELQELQTMITLNLNDLNRCRNEIDIVDGILTLVEKELTSEEERVYTECEEVTLSIFKKIEEHLGIVYH